MTFKQYFLLRESPDGTIKRFPDENGETFRITWNKKDSRTFIIVDNFICVAEDHAVFHEQLYSMLEDVFQTDDVSVKEQMIMLGQPSEEFKEIISGGLHRGDAVEEYPEWIQGRAWLDHEYISFWNNSYYVKNNLAPIIKMIKILGGNPNTWDWELDHEAPVKLTTLMGGSKSEEPAENEIKDWQREVHILPPEKKGDALKAMGVKPKVPLGAQARYLRGESLSFKEYFGQRLLKENPDNLYYTNVDSRTFAFCPNFVMYHDKPVDDEEMSHYELLTIAKKVNLGLPNYHFCTTHYLGVDENEVDEDEEQYFCNGEKFYRQKGNIPEELVEIFKNNKRVTRDGFRNEIPDAFTGRISFERQEISFWQSPREFNEIAKKMTLEVFTLYATSPEDYEFSFYDSGRTYRMGYAEFMELGNEQNPSKEKSNADTSHIIHMLPPEKKGLALKAMGVKPKPAMGVQQRYLRGESFKDFFHDRVVEERKEDGNKIAQISDDVDYKVSRIINSVESTVDVVLRYSQKNSFEEKMEIRGELRQLQFCTGNIIFLGDTPNVKAEYKPDRKQVIVFDATLSNSFIHLKEYLDIYFNRHDKWYSNRVKMFDGVANIKKLIIHNMNKFKDRLQSKEIKSYLVHEFIHMWDDGNMKGTDLLKQSYSRGTRMADKKEVLKKKYLNGIGAERMTMADASTQYSNRIHSMDQKEYYNNSSEQNAYILQALDEVTKEGVSSLEDFFDRMKEKMSKIIPHMTKDNKQSMWKRIYQFYDNNINKK
jgi:hypothetical protein